MGDTINTFSDTNIYGRLIIYQRPFLYMLAETKPFE